MSFHSGVRTWHVYGWVSIIWIISAIAGSEGIELQTLYQVAARCGENVTLPCQAIKEGLDIKLFAWVNQCDFVNGSQNPDALCKRTEDPPYSLTLTLLNVMPVNQGVYICKIHSNQGTNSATTAVTVQDCLGSSNGSINGSHANCRFSGVYPSGIIHWSQGDVNFTDDSSTQEKEDQHGRYDVQSTIDVEKGNLSQPYKCSLWIPSAGKYLSNHQLPIFKELESTGSMVRLQWIFIVVEVMTVKLMT